MSLSIAAGGLGIGGAALASTLEYVPYSLSIFALEYHAHALFLSFAPFPSPFLCSLSPEEGFQGISPGAIGWPSILAAGLALSSGAAAVLAEKPVEDEARPSSREAHRDSSMPMKFLGGTKLFVDALYSRLVTAFKGDMLVDELSTSLSDRETPARSAAGRGDAEDWLLGAAWVRMSSNIGYMLVPLFYLAVTIASASSEGVLLTQSKGIQSLHACCTGRMETQPLLHRGLSNMGCTHHYWSTAHCWAVVSSGCCYSVVSRLIALFFSGLCCCLFEISPATAALGEIQGPQ